MQADNMSATGSWYAEDWNSRMLVDYFSIRPPLYASIILFFRLFSNSIFALLIFQNIISIFTCWLIYNVAQQQGFFSKKTQRIFWAGVLLYPAQMIHANFVMTEIVFQLWLTSIFITLFNFVTQPSFKRSALLAFFLSLCLLTKPVSLFLPFLVWGFMGWSVFKKKASWQLLFPQIIVLLTFQGICMQNQHATGYYHYSSIKSINQLKYNARYTLVAAKGEQHADSVVAAVMHEADAAANYGDRLTIMNDYANRIIMEYPLSFAKVYTKGVLAFFIDPGRFDMFHFFALEEKGTVGLMHEMQTKGLSALVPYIRKAPVAVLVLLVICCLWNIAVTAAFIYFACTCTNHALRNIVLILILYIALATGPVGVSRYRVPVFPLLLTGVLCAAYQHTHRKQTAHA